MINIELGNLRITSDDRSYIVSEVKQYLTGKKKGLYYEDRVGYYTTSESLEKGLVELLIKRSDATTLDELREAKINALHEVTGVLYD